jgi:hypothetical protein
MYHICGIVYLLHSHQINSAKSVDATNLKKFGTPKSKLELIFFILYFVIILLWLKILVAQMFKRYQQCVERLPWYQNNQLCIAKSRFEFQ